MQVHYALHYVHVNYQCPPLTTHFILKQTKIKARTEVNPCQVPLKAAAVAMLDTRAWPIVMVKAMGPIKSGRRRTSTSMIIQTIFKLQMDSRKPSHAFNGVKLPTTKRSIRPPIQNVSTLTMDIPIAQDVAEAIGGWSWTRGLSIHSCLAFAISSPEIHLPFPHLRPGYPPMQYGQLPFPLQALELARLHLPQSQ
jgi:hypothetical protein